MIRDLCVMLVGRILFISVYKSRVDTTYTNDGQVLNFFLPFCFIFGIYLEYEATIFARWDKGLCSFVFKVYTRESSKVLCY